MLHSPLHRSYLKHRVNKTPLRGITRDILYMDLKRLK